MNMNVGKKVDRFRQYAREKMGGDVATTSTDEFKALQLEMDLRHQGMDRLQQSTNAYIKSMSTRDQGTKQEKQIPVGHFGSTLVSHGDDFEPESEFGQCLQGLGRANERIARMQETYCANATSSWLESVERSLVQMKEYQAARKKLDSRRLAFDTASGKMQKSKKEDFRMEEELRNQKQKYEESQEEVERRMLDIKEAEADSVADLTSFLEAELVYYERCRDVLLQLKKDWPATLSQSDAASSVNGSVRRTARSRGNSVADRFSKMLDLDEDEPLEPPPRPTIGSRAFSGSAIPGVRPQLNRNASAFEGPTSLGREVSAPAVQRISRTPTDSAVILGARNGLRATKQGRAGPAVDTFGDDQSDDSSLSDLSRTSSMLGHDGSLAKRAPPPPPPSRSTKPKPPPPPFKRSSLSTSEIPRY